MSSSLNELIKKFLNDLDDKEKNEFLETVDGKNKRKSNLDIKDIFSSHKEFLDKINYKRVCPISENKRELSYFLYDIPYLSNPREQLAFYNLIKEYYDKDKYAFIKIFKDLNKILVVKESYSKYFFSELDAASVLSQFDSYKVKQKEHCKSIEKYENYLNNPKYQIFPDKSYEILNFNFQNDKKDLQVDTDTNSKIKIEKKNIDTLGKKEFDFNDDGPNFHLYKNGKQSRFFVDMTFKTYSYKDSFKKIIDEELNLKKIASCIKATQTILDKKNIGKDITRNNNKEKKYDLFTKLLDTCLHIKTDKLPYSFSFDSKTKFTADNLYEKNKEIYDNIKRRTKKEIVDVGRLYLSLIKVNDRYEYLERGERKNSEKIEFAKAKYGSNITLLYKYLQRNIQSFSSTKFSRLEINDKIKAEIIENGKDTRKTIEKIFKRFSILSASFIIPEDIIKYMYLLGDNYTVYEEYKKLINKNQFINNEIVNYPLYPKTNSLLFQDNFFGGLSIKDKEIQKMTKHLSFLYSHRALSSAPYNNSQDKILKIGNSKLNFLMNKQDGISLPDPDTGYGYLIQIPDTENNLKKDEYRISEIYKSYKKRWGAIYIDRVNKAIYEFNPFNGHEISIYDRTNEIKIKDNNIFYFYSPSENNHLEAYFERYRCTKVYLDETISIPEEKSINPLLFNNIKTDTSIEIGDYSLLYSMYFLICMSANLPDENGYPLNLKGENVFKEFFDPLLLDYEYFNNEVGNVDNLLTRKVKAESKYIKHVKNISEQISKLLFDME